MITCKELILSDKFWHLEELGMKATYRSCNINKKILREKNEYEECGYEKKMKKSK